VIRFSAPIAAASGETGRREISGVAAPYGVDAIVSDGTAVRFKIGALPEDGPAPKLIESHDLSQIRGIVTERVNTDEGMMFTARIAPTAAGNDALELVKMGAIDSVSVGVTPTKWHMDGDTMVIEAADWMELSLVAIPAFAGATINQVAAQAATETTPTVSEEEAPMANEPQVEATAPATIPTVPTAPIYATIRKPRLPSPGDYIAAMRRGGSDFAQLNANLAAEIQAATGDVLVSDAAGVIPTPILGPVYDAINPLRPIVTALGARAMPSAGATFIRPFVKVRSSVGIQANELAALSTADFEVDDKVVTKKTFGGKLILSEQVIDWSSPSMLDQAIIDMAGQYALATEKEVVDTMAGAVTNSQEVITDLTDGEKIIEKLYEAAASISATGNYLPNAAVVAPAIWAKLGAAVDGQGRPLFPLAGPVNSAGQLPQGTTGWNGNILGLTLVVSNQVGVQDVGNKDANEYIWLLNTRGVETYESFKGFIRDESVGTLGVTIAVRGYFAASIMDINMIRILGPDATFA
jgi:HK97 family phage prohead protease